MTPFCERIERRYETWWGPVRSPGVAGWKERLHRRRERFTYRDATVPLSAWKCCPNWQRSLANKWNARQFVQKYGIRVSGLYASGRWIPGLPFASLPDQYVVRPNYGHSRNNVFPIVSEIDMLRGNRCSKEDVRRHLIGAYGRFARVPLLLQEFVRTEDGEYQLPIEYQCHMFGGVVGAIQVIRRRIKQSSPNRFYSEAWEPFADKMRAMLPLAEYRDPPRCLDEMLRTVKTLGEVYGTYVRIDVFATDKGCVFNEFAPTPARGANFTPFANEYFGRLWEKYLGDAL
jgi:hypothetical protein